MVMRHFTMVEAKQREERLRFEAENTNTEREMEGNNLSLKDFDQMEKEGIIISNVSKENPFKTMEVDISLAEAKIKEFCPNEVQVNIVLGKDEHTEEKDSKDEIITEQSIEEQEVASENQSKKEGKEEEIIEQLKDSQPLLTEKR
jgi:hypothetical protein